MYHEQWEVCLGTGSGLSSSENKIHTISIPISPKRRGIYHAGGSSRAGGLVAGLSESKRALKRIKDGGHGERLGVCVCVEGRYRVVVGSECPWFPRPGWLF